MTIVAPNGDRSKAQLGVGKSYFRKAGVEHDVLNESGTEIVFLEGRAEAVRCLLTTVYRIAIDPTQLIP